MIKKHILSIVLVIIVGLFAYNINAYGDTYSLYVGETEYLYPPEAPRGTELYNVQWSTKNTNITIHTRSYGTAEITIDKYFSGAAQVICDYYYRETGTYQYSYHSTKTYSIACKPVTLEMNPKSVTIKKGQTVFVNYTTNPYGKSPKITWTSDDVRVANVSNGYIIGVSAGETAIKAEQNMGPAGICGVTVIASDPTSIEVLPRNAELAIGESIQLQATLYPSDATSSVEWSVSSYDSYGMVSVSSSGRVTAYSKGRATICARTSNGLTAYCNVTVYSVDPTSIALSKSSASIAINENLQLKANLEPNNASTTLTWSSNNPKVASVSQEGLVTGVSAGNTIISVSTSNGKKATCNVSVYQFPDKISIPATISMPKGSSRTIEVTMEPKDSKATLTWSSSNTNIASVSQDGVVSAVNEGEAIIYVKTSNGLSSECRINVTEPVAPTKVELVKKAATISVGYYIKLACTLSPQDASTQYSWKSSDTSIATVSTLGYVKGLSEGSVTITVTTANGLTAESVITVVPVSEKNNTNNTIPIIEQLKTLAYKAADKKE